MLALLLKIGVTDSLLCCASTKVESFLLCGVGDGRGWVGGGGGGSASAYTHVVILNTSGD